MKYDFLHISRALSFDKSVQFFENMYKSLLSFEECKIIIEKSLQNDSEGVEVIDYDVKSYCDGYPGFLGDYFSLKIKISHVSLDGFGRQILLFSHYKFSLYSVL